MTFLTCAPTAAERAEPLPGTFGERTDVGQNLVQNGSFERPVVEDAWVAFFPGTQGIPGWIVEDESVDVVSSDWVAAEGRQSLGLNGFGPGTISQQLPTKPGKRYLIGFELAADPNGPPSISEFRIGWSHALRGATTTPLAKHYRWIETLIADATDHSPTDPGWSSRSVVVRATSTSSVLTFQGLTDTNAGPALDDIYVVRLP